MGLCPFVVPDRSATWASNRGFEFVSVLLGDSFPLDSCSLKWQQKDWDRVHSNFWSVHCPVPVCHSPRYSNHTVDGFCVPSALRFESSDFASSECTICTPNETLFRIPSQIPYWYLGFILFIGSVVICLASTFSPNGTNSMLCELGSFGPSCDAQHTLCCDLLSGFFSSIAS